MSEDDITPVLIPMVDPGDSEWARPTDDTGEPRRPDAAEYPVVAEPTDVMPAQQPAAAQTYRRHDTPRPLPPRQVAAEPAQQPRRRARPRRRRSSPVWLRVICGVAALAAIGGGALLMLTDRAPQVVQSLFGDRARELWVRIDASSETINTAPPADTAVHVVVWASVVALTGIALWSIWALIGFAIVSALAGIGVEVAQARWTETRAMELRDVTANLVGIGVGVAITVAVMLSWRLITLVWRSIVR